MKNSISLGWSTETNRHEGAHTKGSTDKERESVCVFGLPSSLHLLKSVWHSFTMSGCDPSFGMPWELCVWVTERHLYNVCVCVRVCVGACARVCVCGRMFAFIITPWVYGSLCVWLYQCACVFVQNWLCVKRAKWESPREWFGAICLMCLWLRGDVAAAELFCPLLRTSEGVGHNDWMCLTDELIPCH